MSFIANTFRRLTPLCLSSLLLLAFAGCKAKPPQDDATLATSVQGQIAGDSALSGLQISSKVEGGVATVSGSVLNDAQRTLAARDAAGTAGIKEVINNISIVSAAAVAPPPLPLPAPPTPLKALIAPPAKPAKAVKTIQPAYVDTRRIEPAPIERPQRRQLTQNDPPLDQSGNTSLPAPPVQQAPPPPPAFHEVTIPTGTSLPVRITQTLDSATTQVGDKFTGVVASDILIDGVVAIPAGSAVAGHVDAVQEAAHFKGSSLLTVSLASVSRRGDRLPVTSDPYTVQGNGRGKNTAEKVGGGAAVGAILGGIFGGGKGAAIGAAAGGGVGAGAQAVTRGQQVQIQSETVVRFRLTTALTVRVRGNDAPQ